MTTSVPTCTLCGDAGELHNPLVAEEFYPGVQLHLHCLNSPAGLAWIAARSATDPGFARYQSLITVGRPIGCAACGAPERVSPKAYGMSAGQWELNCSACHRSRPLLNGYRSPVERTLLLRLQTLEQHFKLGRDVPAVLREVATLAAEADAALAAGPCECGGAFSIAAPPRCGRCASVVLESPFHITIGPAPLRSAVTPEHRGSSCSW